MAGNVPLAVNSDALPWTWRTIDELKAPIDGAIAIGPFGSRMKSDCYVKSGVPVIRGTNLGDTQAFVGDWVFIDPALADRMGSAVVVSGDLVFPHRGSIGQVGIVPPDGPERFVLSSSLMKLTCDRLVADPDFLFYYFRSSAGRHELLKNASTVGTPGIGQPLTSLRAIKVHLPPIAQQTAIGCILGSLDQKIEFNRRHSQTLEATARAFFKDWFVDFGPVLAKAERREPYLARDVWDVMPNRLDGGFPQGWKRGPVGDWIAFNPPESLRRGVVAPYLDMAALPTEGATADEPVPREFGSGMKFRNGDTLMARITPCLENGKTAYVQSLPDSAVAWGSTEFIVMRPIPPVSRPYAYLLARDAAFREHAIRSMTGTSGRQRAQVQAIESFPVCLPTEKPVWDAFAAVLDPLFAGIRANANESRTLSELRDALLPKLISGDIRIRDAERFIEEAIA